MWKYWAWHILHKSKRGRTSYYGVLCWEFSCVWLPGNIASSHIYIDIRPDRYIRPAENTYRLKPLYKISHVVIKDLVHTTHPECQLNRSWDACKPLLKSSELMNAQLWSSFDKSHRLCRCAFNAFNRQQHYRFPDLPYFHNPSFFRLIWAPACLSSCLSLSIHLMIL